MPDAVDTPNGSELLVTPGDKREDCACRGGAWYGTNEFGYCVPGAVQTGKRYSKTHKGCVALSPEAQEQAFRGQRPVPVLTFEQMLVKYGPWIVAGVAGVALVILLARKR